ncbi:MAG TPA: amidohydrolase family protein [Syntrophorhabdaceae bacterium]
MKIDMHSHIEIREALDFLSERPVNPMAPKPGHMAYDYTMEQIRKMGPQLQDPARRIADLDQMGLDMAVLSIAPTDFFYALPAEQTFRICRFENDRLAALVHEYPERLAAMATVPLQDVGLAGKELERSVQKLGLKGVEIGTNVNGAFLGEEQFLPFFETAAALGVPVYIHPHNPAGADRMKDYYFFNVLGFPMDTTLAAGSLIYSGIFDKLPGLKLILSHAGGALPYVVGRMNHARKIRPECTAPKKPPEEYVKMFHYDTISHGADQLRFLISAVGADHVLLGTDYPYDMGDADPLASIEAIVGLSAEERAKIEGENATKLFKL